MARLTYSRIRPLAELEEHCPAVVFYWRLVFVNVSGLTALLRERVEA